MKLDNIRRNIVRTVLAVATAAAVLIGFSTTAAASHYDLVDIKIVNEDVRTKLAAEGIEDTQTLLARMLTSEDRAKIVKITGMDKAEVQELARMLELMQITGIGPKAARLLILSGVTSIGDLAQRTAEDLLPDVLEANAEHGVTGIDPDELILADWIAKAGKVPMALE